MVIVSSSIIDITKVHDTKPLQLFVSSNQPKTQVYNADNSTYTPDWTTNKPVLTAELYRAGSASNIISQAAVQWLEDSDGYAIGGGTEYTLGAGNQTLTVNKNIIAEPYLKLSGGYVDFGTGNWSNQITFEQWVIPSAVNGTAYSLFTKELNYKFRISAGNIQGLVGTNGTSWTNSGLSWNAGIVANNLYHIVTQADLVNGTAQVYVNGTSLGQLTFAGAASPVNAGTHINFGSYNNTSGELFSGKFLGGRIYNRLLTAAEVTNNYNGTITTNGLVSQYLLPEGQGTTTADSVGTATGTIHGTPRWNDPKKIITCVVTYTDPDTNTSVTAQGTVEFEKLTAGQKGPQGATATDTPYLTNDTAVVTTANDGSGGTYGSPNTATTLQIFRGVQDVTSQYTISQTRNNVTVTEAASSATATVTAMSADTGSVVFTATLTGHPTITKTFSLAKSKMGVVGQTPTSYWVNTSATTITVADDGSYSPSSVTISSESQAGTAAPAAYTGRFVIAESTDGTNFTTKYTSSADESSHAYTPSGAGVKAIKATLYQAGGTSLKLDEQLISMVGNGKNSVTVNAWTPTGSIIHNAGNTVTAQADILNGGNLTTADNYRWVKQNPQAPITLLNGAGWEDLDLGKDNIIPNSDLNSTSGWSGFTSVDPGYLPGTKGITLTRSGYVGTNRAFEQYNLPSGTLTAGKSYTFSCWFKLNSSTPMDWGGSSTIFVRCYNDNTGTTGFSEIITLNITNTYQYDTWYFVQGTGTYPSGLTGYIQVSLGLGYNGSVTISNWKLEEGTQASNWNKRFTDLTVDPTDNTLYGENILYNGDFAITATNSSVGWDNTLNGTLVPNSGWSNGYNSGVPAPTTGYHAHLNSAKFGYPVLEFIDKNSTYGYTHRWLGMSEWLSPSQFQFQVGQTYTISFEAQTDTANMVVNCGFYHNLISGGSSTFNGFQWTFPQLTSTGVWIKQYKTFTVDSTWDVTKATSVYVYGYFSSVEGTIWVRNVKVETGTIATEFTNRPEDNSANYPKQTAGLGKWIYKNYPNAGGTSTAPSYSTIQGETTGLQRLISESSNLVQSNGTNYTGYLKTALYVPTARTVSVSLQHDDGMQAYLNGVSIYLNNNWTPSPVTITYNFQPGWNEIEFIWNQGTGGDGIYNISPAFGTIGEEINANYALDYGPLKGNYGIIGYNTNSMVVNSNAVTDTDQFQVVVTYRGTTYKDSVTIENVTDPITLKIFGSANFKNGQGTNTFTAKLYQNSTEIDSDGTMFTYTWHVNNQDGSQDLSFGGSGSKTGKTITVSASDINAQCTLVCDVE